MIRKVKNRENEDQHSSQQHTEKMKSDFSVENIIVLIVTGNDKAKDFCESP